MFKILAPFLCVIPLISTAAFSGEPENILLRASGITEKDIKNSRDKEELNLFNVFALSIRHNNPLMVKKEEITIARARKDQAFGSFLPRISLKGALNYPEQNRYSSLRSSVYLYARQSIITGLNEISAYRGYRSEIKQRKCELSQYINLLLNDVSMNFYRVSIIMTNLKSKKHILGLYHNVLRELKRRVALGRSRRSEVLRINSEIYSLQSVIKGYETDLASARLSLASLTGIPVNAVLVTGHTLKDPVDPGTTLKKIIDKRWDVRAAREAVKAADNRVLAARGQHLPSIYLEGAYMLHTEKRSGKDYYASLGAELPLFSGGMVNARIREEKSALKQAELKLAETVKNAGRNITDAYQTWNNSRGEMEAYRLAYVSAEKNYNVIMHEYRLNLVTIIDVFNALTTLSSAKQEYEDSRLRLSYNRIRLGIELNEFSGKGIADLKNAMTEITQKEGK